MAITINPLVTSVLKNKVFSDYELDFAFSDTIKCTAPIYFAINLNYLNELFSNASLPTVTSQSINTNTKSLIVFLCSSIDGNDNFVNASIKTYSLSSANLSDGILRQSLSGVDKTFTLTHDDLCDISTQEECYQLCKEYKIIFRITNTSSPILTQSLQNGDIVNDFKLMFDTFQNGPYSVAMKNIDIFSPQNFSFNEMLEVYTNNAGLFSNETQRFFYPSELESLAACPLLLILHGQNHNFMNYDTYANIFASYGYVVICVCKEAGDNVSAPSSGSRPAMIIRHLQLYSNKFENGIFNNKIDFDKIFLIGHSVGAASIAAFVDQLTNNNSIPSLPDISLQDIVAISSLEGSNIGNAANSYPTFFVNGRDLETYDSLQLMANSNTFVAGYLAKYFSHEDLAFPFSPVSSGPTFPTIPILPNGVLQLPANESPSFISNPIKSFNNDSITLYLIAERLLQYYSICFKNKIKKYYYTNNFDYESEYKKQKMASGQLFFKIGENEIEFIERYSNTNKFTTNISGATTVRGLSGGFLNSWQNQLSTIYPNESFSVMTTGYTGNSGYIFVYDGTNKNITYDLSASPLNLSGNSYIGVMAGIIHSTSNTGPISYPIKPTFSSNLYCNFNLELICNSGATSATINSRQNNFGIMDQPGLVENRNGFTGNANSLSSMNCIPGTILFLASDFKNKVSGLTLSNITGLKLHFNSLAGSTIPNGKIILNGIYTF